MGWFSTQDGVAFIHIPKTGGVSIRKWGKTALGKRCRLIHKGRKHMTIYQIRKKVDQDLPTSFAVVRNPYDRAVSAWAYYKDKNKTELTFKAFLSEPSIISKQQCSYIDDETIILRYEDLEYDFKKIQKMFEREHIRLPTLNASKRKRNYRVYYSDDETKWMVREAYEKDFERFNYSF